MPRTGRILSLGFPLPGSAVDNYNFLSAPSFFDYDALVVDPASLATLIEGILAGAIEERTFGDAPVRNAPAAPGVASLGDVLVRRRDETRLLLERGGIVVCFARPPSLHRGIVGADPYGDDDWLGGAPAAAGLRIVPADGTRVSVTDYEHPIAAFVEGQSANIAYAACFERAGEGVRVFATSAGGQAVAADAPALAGRLVYVPALRQPPPGDQRYVASDALQAGIRRMLGVAAEGREPPWIGRFPVPGIDERRQEMQDAHAARDAAASAAAGADAAYDALARYRRLLWQEGALGLEEVVVESLRLLGFDVHVDAGGAIDLRSEPTTLVEVAASEHAVELEAHHRLRQRIERVIEARGSAPRGVLFVNGYRLQPPGERPEQVTDRVRTAAETMRYCVATTASLFDAVVAALCGRDDEVAAYRERLCTHDGLL